MIGDSLRIKERKREQKGKGLNKVSLDLEEKWLFFQGLFERQERERT